MPLTPNSQFSNRLSYLDGGLDGLVAQSCSECLANAVLVIDEYMAQYPQDNIALASTDLDTPS